jgi:DNA-binding response OmpR family regulator
LRLLLIEDNLLFGDALRDHFGALGWSVAWAQDFATGLAALKAGPYDVLCLDRRMPDGDGFDVLRRGLARCPTVVISAFDQMSDALEARRLGAADYLVKPVALHEVVRRILLVSATRPSAPPTIPTTHHRL